jgi:hypothetical protein
MFSVTITTANDFFARLPPTAELFVILAEAGGGLFTGNPVARYADNQQVMYCAEMIPSTDPRLASAVVIQGWSAS